jgi:hypothetical protein
MASAEDRRCGLNYDICGAETILLHVIYDCGNGSEFASMSTKKGRSSAEPVLVREARYNCGLFEIVYIKCRLCKLCYRDSGLHDVE